MKVKLSSDRHRINLFFGRTLPLRSLRSRDTSDAREAVYARRRISPHFCASHNQNRENLYMIGTRNLHDGPRRARGHALTTRASLLLVPSVFISNLDVDIHIAHNAMTQCTAKKLFLYLLVCVCACACNDIRMDTREAVRRQNRKKKKDQGKR